MKAKVSFSETIIGCQKINGNLSNFSAGSIDKTIIVEFEYDPKLTFKVSALKELNKNHPIYQFGNSYTYRSNFKVDIYEEEVPLRESNMMV